MIANYHKVLESYLSRVDGQFAEGFRVSDSFSLVSNELWMRSVGVHRPHVLLRGLLQIACMLNVA